MPRGPGAVAISLFTAWSFLSCRCRGGRVRPCVSPAAAAAHSSTHDRTARSVSGPLGVRMKSRRRLPTAARASGARGLRRDRPSAAPANGKPAHPKSLPILIGCGERSARRVGRPSLRRPRGPQRAEPGWGVGDEAFCGHRGAPPRDALLGRGLRSLGAPRAGASQRREAAHPPGKKNASRSEK